MASLVAKNRFINKETGKPVEVGEPFTADKERAEKLVQNGFALYSSEPEAKELKEQAEPKGTKKK